MTCRAMHGFPAVIALQLLAVPLAAQAPGDTLAAGKRAYERAEFDAAARLLTAGLVRAPRDTAWTSALHMLLDVLLAAGDTAGADAWARWGARVNHGLRPDSAFPPRVSSRVNAALGGRSDPAADDTLAATDYLPTGEPGSRRGLLRIGRSSQALFVTVGELGTLLPGETRSLPAGTWALRVTGDGLAPIEVRREVLPGIATVVTVRLRSATAAASVAAPAAGGGTVAAIAPRGAQVAAGGATTCQVLADARAACWGDNRSGQFGAGSADSLGGLGTVAIDSALAVISMGSGHGCGLTRAGRAWCWGAGVNGQLGNGQTAASRVPVAVPGGPFGAIAVGALHSCALDARGAAWCWGTNRDGELGNRSSTASAVPMAVAMPPGVAFASLTAGGSHTCGLTAAGVAWCWGANWSGQLGNGGTGGANQPVAVQGGATFRLVAAGLSHNCGVTGRGSALCWGGNGFGQLGSGAGGGQASRPTPVSGLSGTLTGIEAGDMHTCVLTSDNATWCWGAGRAGQLGNGQFADSPRPVLVIGGHDFRALSLGAQHSCGTTADAVTWCWGDNAAGQAGSLAGSGIAAATPVALRAPLRTAAPRAAPVRSVREMFNDDWRADPAWSADSAGGSRINVIEGALSVSRTAPRGGTAALPAGLAIPVAVPVQRTTSIQFDVMLERAAAASCGLNCTSWPASVRLRVRSTDLTESELWFVFGPGDSGTATRTMGNLVIVERRGLVPGRWLRGVRYAIAEYLPRADTVLHVAMGGFGTDYGARFDNVVIPAPLPASLALPRQVPQLTGARPTQQLTAVALGAAGDTLAWVIPDWSSSDTAVVRVDESGVVTGVRPGGAVIRARSGSLADSVRVRSTVPAARRQPTRAPRPATRP